MIPMIVHSCPTKILLLVYDGSVRLGAILYKTGCVWFPLNRFVWGTRESYKQAGKREGDGTSLPKRRL